MPQRVGIVLRIAIETPASRSGHSDTPRIGLHHGQGMQTGPMGNAHCRRPKGLIERPAGGTGLVELEPRWLVVRPDRVDVDPR